MAVFQMQIATEYPVLFLSTGGDDVVIPDDTGSFFASATTNCLSFRVLSHVDGASMVTISDGEPQASGSLMFSGQIAAPSGVLTISDSDAFRYLNIPVHEGRIQVDVWADDIDNPDWVWIKLDAIRSY